MPPQCFPEPVPVPAQTSSAAERLHAALLAAGFTVPGDVSMVRADVTTSGDGQVTVGRLPTATALRLAEVLEWAVEAGLEVLR